MTTDGRGAVGDGGLPVLPDGLPTVDTVAPLAGGDTARAWRVGFVDGTRAVVKATPYLAELEAEGLAALRDAGGPVPATLAVGTHVLVLEEVGGPPAWEALGAALAGVHAHTGRAFGWHRDNVIGPLEQLGGWSGTSGELVVERRIRPHLDALPTVLADRLNRACEVTLPALLDGHGPAPSLVHGDLWSGNVVAGRWLIDPAVHHADRETDLAMLHLFGNPPSAFTCGYREVAPLPDGWERRRPALQLHPLLVHVRLFGGGYVDAVARALDDAGL